MKKEFNTTLEPSNISLEEAEAKLETVLDMLINLDINDYEKREDNL